MSTPSNRPSDPQGPGPGTLRSHEPRAREPLGREERAPAARAHDGGHGARALVAVVVLVPLLAGLALAASAPPAGAAANQPAGAGSGTAAPPAAGAARGDSTAGAVQVVDVVPADPDDPRGAALAASVLPLVLAVDGVVAGLAALFGRAGAALGALLMVLVGNPLSGVSSAPELLPEPAGAIGQLLPPGAGGSLLRSTAFFDGAGGAAP